MHSPPMAQGYDLRPSRSQLVPTVVKSGPTYVKQSIEEHETMDDTAKKGAKLTLELFTMILCGLNFAVS